MTSILVDIARNRTPFTLSVGNRNVSKFNGQLRLSNFMPEKFYFNFFHVKDGIFIFDLYSATSSYGDVYLPDSNDIITGYDNELIRHPSKYYAKISNTNPIFIDLFWKEAGGILYSVGPSRNDVIRLLPEDNSIGFVLTPIYSRF